MTEQIDGTSTSQPSSLQNVGWLLLERVARILLTLGVGVVLARSLGPRDFGVLAFAIALVGLFLPLVEIGRGVVVRDLVAFPERRGEILGSAIALQASAAIAAAIGVAVIAGVVIEDHVTRLLILVLAVPLLVAPLYVVDFWFQAELRARQASTARMVALVVSSALKVAAVWLTGSLLWLGVATAAETLIGGPLMLWVYRRQSARARRWRLSAARLSSIARRSIPLMFAGLFVAIYMRIDQVMLGSMSSKHEAGLYAVVTRISEAAYFVGVAIMTAEAPGLTRSRQTDRRTYEERTAKMLSYLAACAIVFTLPVALFSSQLITILFGESFEGAARVLTVHVLSTVFVFLGVGGSPWTVNEGTHGVVLLLALAGAAVNVLLNLWWIPAHGALGAAYATLVAYAIAGVLGNVVHRRTRPLFWMQMRSLNPVTAVQLVRSDLRTLLSPRG